LKLQKDHKETMIFLSDDQCLYVIKSLNEISSSCEAIESLQKID